MKRVLSYIGSLNIYALIVLFGLAYLALSGFYLVRLDQQMRADVLEQADLLAAQFNAMRIAQLDGQYSDLSSINYLQIKDELITARNSHPQNRFIYIMGMRPDQTVFIYGDSEVVNSPDYSPPGQLYPEAAAQMRNVFASGRQVLLTPLTDRWGTWVSAAAPVLDSKKNVAAVIRIDIALSDWGWELAGKAALPLWLLFGIFTGLILTAAIQRQGKNPSHVILKRLMMPITLILSFFILFTVGLFWNQQQKQLEEYVTPIVTDVGYDIHTGLEHQADSLSLMSQTISLNPVVQDALAKKDRTILQAQWQPVFVQLVTQYNLFEFDFLDSARKCLISVDGMEPCTNEESHFTTLEAQKTGQPAHGLEIDETGTLVVRVVYPVKNAGKIVGYLETARDVKKLVESTSLQAGVQMAVVLKKQFLEQQSWENSMQEAGQKPDWNAIPDGVISFSTSGQLLDIFLPWAERVSRDPTYVQTGMEITPQTGSGDAKVDDRTWRVAAIPLMDVSGTEIGHILVMLDFSEQKRAFIQRLTLSAGVSAALLAVLLGLIYMLLNRADKFVYQQQLSLGASDDRFQQMFEQDTSAMLLIEPGSGKILDANRSAGLFYGYSVEKLKSMFRSDLDVTNPEDLKKEQEAFNRLEKKQLTLKHRLSSGVVRDVLEFSSEINLVNKPVIFSVIEDVTERSLAEKALQHENESLSNLLELSEKFIEDAGLEDNFDQLTNSVLKIADAEAVVFNLYNEQEKTLQTRAIAGVSENLKKASSILGFDLVGHVWQYDEKREKSIEGQLIAHIPSLSSMIQAGVAVTVLQMIERVFHVGEVVFAKIVLNNKIIGEFMIIMRAGKKFTADRLLEVYLRQAGLMAERNLEETARRKSERSLQMAKQSARFGIIDYDLETRKVYWDEMAQEIWGMNPGSEVNISELIERLHPDDLSSMRAALSKIFSEAGSQPVFIECRLRSEQSGEYRWISISGQTRFADGKPAGLNGIIQEISSRKQIEGALAASQDRYQQLFDHSLDGVLLLEENGRITSANPAAELIFGRSEAELKTLSWQAAAEQSEPLVSAKNISQHESSLRTEYTAEKGDGTKILLDVTSSHFTDNNGTKSIGLTLRDVTVHRRLEEQLRESTDLLNSLMQFSPIYLFIKEVEGDKSYTRMASENYRDMLGIPGSQMVGKTNEEIFPADLARSMTADDITVARGGKIIRSDEIFNDRNYTNIKFPFVQNGKTMTAGYSIDMTDLRNAEFALKASEARYKAVTQTAQEAIVTTDIHGLIVSWNDGAARIFQYSEAEALQHPINMLLPVDYAESHLFSDRRLEYAADPDVKERTIEAVGMKKNGELVQLEISLATWNIGSEIFTTAIARDISARKLAEEKLRVSEERYRLLFENSLDAVLTLYDGKVISANPAACRLFGYASDEFEALSRDDLFDAQDERLEKAVEQRLHDGVFNGELAGLRKDGSRFFAEVSSSFFAEKDGKIVGGIFLRDITLKVEAEAALKASEERFKGLAEIFSESIFEIDLDGTVTYLNRHGLEKTGLTQADLENGFNFKELVIPEHHPLLEARVKERLSGVKTGMLEITAITKEGRRFETLSSSTVILKDGKPAGLRGFMLDISERKRVEKALAENENNFRTFFETVDDVILVCSLDDTIISVNPAVISKLGYETQDLIGKNIQMLYPADLRVEYHAKRLAVLAGTDKSFVLPMLNKNGYTMPLETRMWLGQWNGQPAVFSFSEDLTAEQEALERFEGLFRNNPSLMALSDVETRIIFDVNRPFLEVTGYSYAEVIGKTSAELGLFFNPEQQAAIAFKLKNEGKVHDQELQVMCKDGKIIDGLFSGETIRSGNKRIFLTVMIDITERKKIENELLVNEENLRNAQSIAKLGSWGYDMLSKKTTWSDEIYRIFEVDPADFQADNDSYILFTHPEDRSVVQKAFENALVSGYKKELSHRILLKSGKVKYVQIQGFLVSGDDGIPLRISGTLQDITSLKQAEIELLASESRFRMLVDFSSDLIWSLAYRGLFTYASPSFERVTGYLPELLINQSFTELIHPDDKNIVVMYYQKMAETNTAMDLPEYRFRHADDSWHWHHASVTPVKELDGTVTLVGVSRDITENKKIELALKESEQQYRTLFEDSPISLWEEDYSEVQKRIQLLVKDGIKDFDQYFTAHPEVVKELIRLVKIQNVNKNTMVMLEAGSKEELLKSLDVIFPDIANRTFIQELVMIAYGVKRFELETVNRTLGGKLLTVSMNWAALPGFETELSRVIVSLVDITDRKRAEKELHETNAQLEESIIMANEYAVAAERANVAKSEFLANMSHEIRTPMNGVIGMTSLLLDTPLNSEQRRYAETVNSSGKMLLTLINDILDFSKIEAGKLVLESKEFDLQETLDELMGSLAVRAYERNLDLYCETISGLPNLLIGDQARLKQVITNLVGNAVKFTHKGEVVVSVTWRPEVIGSMTPGQFDVQNILAGAVQELRMVELHFAVRDTGIGIPPEKVDILFNKFTQVDSSVTREYGGTGLGLAISKQLVELMGGSIGVESSVGQGSVFWFTIRLHMQAEKRKEDERLAVLKDVRVLLVHAEDTGSRIIKDRLNQLGMLVETAADQEQVMAKLNYAADEGHPFRLALLDLQLPGLDVMSLAHDIHGDPHISAVRLVLLTTFGNRQNDDLFIQDGFWGVIGKPLMQKEFQYVLLNTVTGRSEDRGRKKEQPAALIRTIQFPEKIRILLVEDNLTNQQVATGILKKIGVPHVDLALNGRLALEALDNQTYDLVLMDVQMPEMDGLEATRRLRSYDTINRNYSVPIVAMTARALAGDRERCLEAGMNDYIAKPFDPAQLVEVLKRWIPIENAGEPVYQDLHSGLAAAQLTVDAETTVPAPVIFDREGLLDRLMHDDDLIKLVVDGFVENIPEQIIALKKYLQDNDIKSAERQAHTIKGAAANVGGEALRGVASEMEKAGHQGNAQSMIDALPELERQYNILRDVLISDLYH